MIGIGLTRRSNSTTAREIVAWLILGIAAVAAIIAAIYAGLGYYRQDDILGGEAAILDAIATLQSCCDAVQDTLATILAKINQLIGATNAIGTAVGQVNVTVNDIDAKLDSIAQTCTPLYEAYQILEPGCYYFANDIDCSDTTVEICFLFDGNVRVNQNGQAFRVHPAAIAYAAYFDYYAVIENGYIYVDSPSNISTSRAVDVFVTDHVVLRDLMIENFFRPISDLYSNDLVLENVYVAGAHAVNSVGYGNRALSMVGTSSVLISDSMFLDNNVQDPAYYGNTYGVMFLSVDDNPAVGIEVRNSVFYNTIVTVGSFGSLVSSGSGLLFDGNVHVVTDNRYNQAFIGWGLFCDTPSVACAAPAAGRIVNSAFVNRDAGSAFDGLYIAGADGLEIANNLFVDNSDGFAPEQGTVNTAAIHICTQNTQVDQGNFPGDTCTGLNVHDNTFVGAVSTNTERRAVIAVLAESGTYDSDIHHNHFSQYGPARYGNGTYPDQYGAVVYVAAGAYLVRVDENTLHDVYCPYDETTFANSGLLAASGETRTQYYPSTGGPDVVFNPSSGVSFSHNEVSGVCGCAYVDNGNYNTMYGNEAHANECSYVSPNAYVQCYGAQPIVVGSNFDFDCLIL